MSVPDKAASLPSCQAVSLDYFIVIQQWNKKWFQGFVKNTAGTHVGDNQVRKDQQVLCNTYSFDPL